MTENEWIEVGKIVAAQGLYGELRVYPDSDFPERFLEPGTRWIQRLGQAKPEPMELIDGRFIPGKGLYVIALEGIENRTQAEALKQAKLLVPIGDRPQLDDGEFHVRDLVGLPVFQQDTGEELGVVVNLIPAGNDLLEVKLNSTPAAKVEEEKPVPVVPNRKSKIRKTRRKSPKPNTILIPFVEAIVPVVDLEQGRIEITPPPGLIE
ncbi:ribosome maturation factor RimM [Roseofilum casamattae]|uniref:Ribosome maturation factor RimM n=1 Tax=Roseofilum casamattae BLCC-M143 TaxID=3022442 RepID=A0ABT7BVX2_9CYAN|nr:ribosome maturation factor RimM [Roseofilum casamattae]MDJ1183347.1 ribosome maturation factor RimM [Roseofilum casamattae BLCC-M143]